MNKSPYNWVGFHPLYNLNNQGFFSLLKWMGFWGFINTGVITLPTQTKGLLWGNCPMANVIFMAYEWG